MSTEVETKTTTEEKIVEKVEPEKIIDEVKEKDVEKKDVDPPKEKEKESEKEKEKSAPAPPPPRVHKTDFEKDVVYLYQFCRTPILPSLSPYCLKVETWLRLYNLKYEVSYQFPFNYSIIQFS